MLAILFRPIGNKKSKFVNRFWYCWVQSEEYLEPLLLTWINFNPSMHE